MAIVPTPEEKMAARLSKKYGLVPPVDVRALLGKYADITDAPIPIEGIDGVCLNLKVSGKRPSVVINSSNPPLRRRFTEAHELGHIVIPWHRGAIVDHLDPAHVEAHDEYWDFEQQANNFAAELLMPSDWLASKIACEPDLAALHATVCEACEVSALAASRRISCLLPANIVFVSVKSGDVEFSGRTEGTLANVPNWGTKFNSSVFGYSVRHDEAAFATRRLHWWTLPSEVDFVATDDRPWREVLDGMTVDIGVPIEDRNRFKMSVNGVLSNANSAMLRGGTHTAKAVVAACLQRFTDRDDLRHFAAHPDFMSFVSKRAEDLTKGDLTPR